MIWTSILAACFSSAAVCLIFGIIFRRRLKRQSSIDNIIKSLGKEIEAMVVELNSTADRNIDLVENRINTLKEMLEKAQKTINSFQREQEKYRLAAEVYTGIEKSRSNKHSIDITVEDTETAGITDPLRTAANSTAPRTSSSWNQTDLNLTARNLSVLNMADQTTPVLNQASPNSTALNQVSQNQENPSMENQPMENQNTSEKLNIENLPVHERVLIKYRNGESIDAISQEMGISPGEVELMISLHQRR